MGNTYILVNIDKKQKIGFNKVDTGLKLRELSGTVIASNIITYYLLTNLGDRIGFINEGNILTVCGKEYDQKYFNDFNDVTNQIVEDLIENEILKEEGIKWIDKEENLFYRDLVNIWDPKIKA